MFSPGHPLADASMAAEAWLDLACAQVLHSGAAAARATLAGFEPPNHRSRRWRLYLEGRADLLVGDPASTGLDRSADRRIEPVGRATTPRPARVRAGACGSAVAAPRR